MKKFDYDSWDTTLWLCLRVIIARFIASIPTGIFAKDLTDILVRLGYLTPLVVPKTLPWTPLTLSFLVDIALMFVIFIAPLAWVWPIGRYIDTSDEALRARAVQRFAGINRFFMVFISLAAVISIARTVWSQSHPVFGQLPHPSLTAAVLLNIFSSCFSLYFTLLTLEPMLFKDMARWLYPGDAIYEKKAGPMFSVRTKLTLLVVNLIVIPMILISASMRLGLTGFSQGMGVAILTAVFAIGYTEMLYHGIARPLSELNGKMSLVAQGDYKAKAAVLAGDEIGQVRSHFNEMIEGLAERERLKDTFGRFVSIEIAKRLIESDQVALGGENIEATVLFSDIRDFTPLSETLPPQDLVSFLNQYFSFITAPIAEHHGVVNKFIGDAVMAVFAPQFGSRDHAADALAAALAMRRKLAEFNVARPGASPVRAGIGVHTGLLVAGNIGTEKRMEYTVIGDTVNVAARIESKTKDLACDILISDGVYSRLGESLKSNVKTERCEGVHVKGKDAALVVYKVL